MTNTSHPTPSSCTLDRETVIRLAREATNSGDGSELSGDAIERFAQLVFLEAAASAVSPSQAQSTYKRQVDGGRTCANCGKQWLDHYDNFCEPAGIQSPAAPVGEGEPLIWQFAIHGHEDEHGWTACSEDFARRAKKQDAFVVRALRIVQVDPAAPVGGEVEYKCAVCGEGCNGCGKVGCPQGGMAQDSDGGEQ